MSNSINQKMLINNGEVAAGDINKITIYNYYKDDFQVNILLELILKLIDSVEECDEELIDMKVIDLKDKNKINNLESYFDDFIINTIKYHDSIEQFIQNLEDDYRDKLKGFLKSLRHFIFCEDGSRILTYKKFQNIFKNFYNKNLSIEQQEYVDILIYYFYCSCQIGEKK